ncbi:MAG: hypothetical protein EOO13_12335 [Chitinophagaceae bacterium]|nr:MAG: hypothetical protein EOO13_12335 [Chitinophagaceae bacterium]
MKNSLLMLLLFPIELLAQAPANDEPCGAVTLAVVSGSACTAPVIYQWQNASFGYSGAVSPSCGNFTNTVSKDVWFKFTATAANASVILSQAYGISHNLAAAFYGSEGCSFLYGDPGCDDDSGPDNYPQLSYFDLIPGQQYFIRVWQTNGAIDTGSARICVVSEPLAPASAVTGINTKFPSAGLDVNGTMKIRGGTPGLNKVLTSDAYGNASWKAVPVASQVSFGAYILPSFSPSIACCSFTKLVFAEAEAAGVTNLTNGTFTAPESALYHFDAAASYAVSIAGTNVSLRIAVLSPANVVVASYETRENNSSVTTERSLTSSVTVRLTAGQKVEVQFYASNTTQINNTGTLGIDRKNRFQGYKIN